MCYNFFGDFMKRFNMIDEEFICDNCHRNVAKLEYSARDHCPYCLFSKHVDILPGDRKNDCTGLLVPIGVEKYKSSYKIIYRCSKCNEIHKNIVARDDDFNKIIVLSIIS